MKKPFVPKIEVLMSTYQGAVPDRNGKPFLESQLESLRGQKLDFEFTVRVRDDGSTDETRVILQRWQERYPGWLSWTAGKNLGPSGSFSALLEESTADYVFFCDQDDVWDPRKMQISLSEMQQAEANRTLGKDLPLLVHTDLLVCDANMEILAESFWDHQAIDPNKNSLNRLLLQNTVTGCTMLINGALRKRIGRIPKEAIMHDWWIAMVAAASGKIIPVYWASVAYRQHGKNVCGTTERALSWAYIWRKLQQPRNGREGYMAAMSRYYKQAQAFYAQYADGITWRLSPAQRTSLKSFVDLPRQNPVLRRWNIFRHGFWKQELPRNLGWLLRV